MADEERTFWGVVRNGVVVPEPGVTLPEGAKVTVTIYPAARGGEPEVARLSEEAVREVDQWERQE